MTLDTHSFVLKQNSTYPYKIQRGVQKMCFYQSHQQGISSPSSRKPLDYLINHFI